MMMTFPETVWSQNHANVLNAAATLAFVPLSFGAMPQNVSQAAPSNPTATSNNSDSSSATARWNAAIEAKIKPGISRQQAAIAVMKERPDLQAAYIEEFRRQAAQRG